VARSRACFAEPQLARGVLARDFLLLPPLDAFLGTLDDEIEQPIGLCHIAAEPMVERVLDGLLDDALRFHSSEAILGLALKLRLANEHREHDGCPVHHIFRRDRFSALALSGAFAVIFQAAGQGSLQAGDMGAAVRGRDRVAV
jgi:hypothetical protein